MSMLSAQCDELRELATRFDEIKVGATRAVRIPLDSGSVLREAADTIDRLDTENAKLRELVRDMWHLMDGSGVTTGAWGRCVQILDRMSELGIEVDE